MLRTMGPCGFDPEKLAFAGEAAEQAECLLRPVAPWGHLGAPLQELPAVLAQRVGRSSLLPTRNALGALLATLDLDKQIEAGLAEPVSRAEDGDPFSPEARYFVIHDTSAPKFGAFPADLDDNASVNDLTRFRCEDSFEKAHAYINRQGEVLVGHDFSVPWRGTKFERAAGFGNALRGLFLHVELIQPRRGVPGHHQFDVEAPLPGFTAAQYDRLALLYTVASVRAGAWLIPAFHAVIDGDIRGGHDDPQNFSLDSFALSLTALFARLPALEGPAPSTAAR